MTKRVRQHQIEDLSRSKFGLAVPRNWVHRDKNKDYGIDIEVEIFSGDNRATGLVFWVQLKATESNDIAIIRKVDLTIESIKYYKRLDIPVLIVRYSEKEDRFYFRWAHEIDLFYVKKNARNIRVSFSEEDIWNEDSPIKVKEYLEKMRAIKIGMITLPIPVYIDIKDKTVNGIPTAVFVSSYRKALKEYPDLAIYQSKPEDALLFVSLSGDELKISLASFIGCVFHGIKDKAHEGLAEGIVANTMIGFAVGLTSIGQFEIAARIVLDKRLKPIFVQQRDLIINLLPSLLKTSFFGVALATIEEVIDSGKDNSILELITLKAINSEDVLNDEEKAAKVESFLKKCLNKYMALGIDHQIGAFYYNLGNHYRARGLFQKSIRHYLKARRYHKQYVNQAYYLCELGGALFGHEKYHLSSMLYKMALNKGASSSKKPLYADALMFSGKYQMAFDVFSEYLKTNKVEHDEWHLKRICLDLLIERTGIKEQTRRKEEALTAIDIKKADEENYVKSLESAIDMDMLCGLAWFNLGVAHSKAGDNRDAAISFTICGLVQPWDITAWVNATLCSLNKEVVIDASTLFLILRTAYFLHGDMFLGKVYEELNNKNNSKLLDRFSNIIEEILPNSGSEKEKPIIRIMGNDGIFRNIIDGETPNN